LQKVIDEGAMRAGIHICAMTAAATLLGAAMACADFVSDALTDLQAYLKAATTLVGQASAGLDKADFAALAPKDRDAAKRSLQTLSTQLGDLFVDQSSLVRQLEFYVGVAKDESKSEQDKTGYWQSAVQPEIINVRKAVSGVVAFVAATNLLTVTLSAEDNLGLRDNLRARGIAIRKFENMPAPISRQDLLQLEGLVADYKVLVDNLFKLRLAIGKAQRRLDGT
jgi:hypothetical protein